MCGVGVVYQETCFIPAPESDDYIKKRSCVSECALYCCVLPDPSLRSVLSELLLVCSEECLDLVQCVASCN